MPSITRCIFVAVPFILTVATLVGLLLTFTGNVSENTIAQKFWFFGIDASALQAADFDLEGWYTVGLWNYCSGAPNSLTPTHCSTPTSGYFFNPTQVFDLPSDLSDNLPRKYHDALTAMHALSRWTFAAYTVSIILCVLTIPISVLAFKRRLGSLLAALVSAATCSFTIGASASATAMYATLFAAVKQGFGEQYDLEPALNRSALASTWFAALASAIAFFFWLFTACCCRGRVAGKEVAPVSPAGDKYQQIQYPGVHERMGGYSAGDYGRGVEMQPQEGRFEPYRKEGSYHQGA